MISRERASCWSAGNEPAERAVVLAVQLGGLADERHELLLEPVEDRAHVGGLHAALVVVEQHVVRLVGLREELDVAPPQLEVVLEEGAERVVVVLRLRLAPRHEALGRRLDHLGAKVRRDARRLLVVLPRDADERRVVRVRVERLLVRAQLLEQTLGLRRDEEVERDPVERRLLLAADTRAGRRHHHLHVPAEHATDAPEVGDLRESCLECLESLRRGHEAEAYPATARCASRNRIAGRSWAAVPRQTGCGSHPLLLSSALATRSSFA
jgi:hypothetical protein